MKQASYKTTRQKIADAVADTLIIVSLGAIIGSILWSWLIEIH